MAYPDPYAQAGYAASDGGSWKDRFVTHFEGAIPLILILILAVFVAGKFGLVDLHSVPLVGGLFPAPTIKVVCVGTCSNGVKDYLASAEARTSNIMFQGELSPREGIFPGVLNNFDVVILQNEKYCDRTAREVIANKVRSGGKLIVVGDACTLVRDDRSILGWGFLMQDVTPAIIGGPTAKEEPVRRTPTNGEFRIVDQQHPIFGGAVPGIKDFKFNAQLVEVIPASNAKILALVVDKTGQPEEKSFFAILESGGLFGKTIYFSYDPGVFGSQKGRELFINAIKYLKTGRA
jgi:hypothetical protein